MTDRRWVREIAAKLRTRSKLGREESTQAIRRVTGELADLAEKAAAEAAAVLRNGRRAVPKALSGRVRSRLRRALDELAVTIERTGKIVAQTRTRPAGQTPESATRLVSLHDPDARRSPRDASASRWSSAAKPRSPATTTVSSPTTASNTVPPRTPRCWLPQWSASTGAPAACHARPRLRPASRRA